MSEEESKLDILTRQLAAVRQLLNERRETLDNLDAPYFQEIAKIEAEAERLINDIRLDSAERVAEIRRRQETARAESSVYNHAQASIYKHEAVEAVLYERIRATAIDVFNSDPKRGRTPASGIKITLRTVLAYREQDAIEWAAAHMPDAVKVELRKQKFETHARAVAKTLPLDFVEIVEAPSVDVDTSGIPYIDDPATVLETIEVPEA